MMKTIQMTIDEALLERVDELIEELDTNRSAFIRLLLEQALEAHHWHALERLDEKGYQQVPPEDKEVEMWLAVQDWGDEWNGAK